MPNSRDGIVPNHQLRRVREQKGWSQQALADKLGVSALTVFRWERGMSFPSPLYRHQLCYALETSLEALGLINSYKTDGDPHGADKQISTPTLGAVLPSLVPTHFIGRDKLLASLKQALYAGHHSIAITGLPGVGKTTLALALANDTEISHYFRDGILWASVGPRPQALSLLHNWGKLLGWSTEDLATFHNLTALGKALQATIRDRRMVLIMDDIWQIADALALQVGGPNCVHLITTRLPIVAHQLAYDNTIAVPELSDEEGFVLLQHLAPESTLTYYDATRSLIHQVGGLPLALILMGHHLRIQELSRQPRRIAALISQLQTTQARLQLAKSIAPTEAPPYLDVGVPLSLEVAIRLSFQDLGEDTRSLLCALALFPAKPNTFSEESAYAISGLTSIEHFVEQLDTLVDMGLIEPIGQNRYSLHQTIADYVRMTDDTHPSQERFVTYFASYVRKHSYDYAIIEQELANILQVLQLGYENQHWGSLIDSVCAYMPYTFARGLYDLGAFHLAHALEAARSIGDESAQSELLNNLAAIEEKQGKNAQTETHASDALSISRRIDDKHQMGKALYLLGAIAYNRGENQHAEMFLLEGLAMSQEIQDHEIGTNLLILLGALFQRNGNHILSQQYLLEGLTIARSGGQQEWAIGFLMNLGTSAGIRGEIEEAETYLQEALQIARVLGYRERMSLALTNLGVAALEQGYLDLALERLLEGLALAREIGKPERICGILINLGEVAVVQGEYTQAEKYIAEGLPLAYEIDHRERLCALLYIGGLAALKQGKRDDARNHLEKGLHIARSIEYPRKIGEILNVLGEYHLQQQQIGDAFLAFREALHYGESSGSRNVIAIAAFGLARIALSQGDLVQARQEGQRSLSILTAIKYQRIEEVEQWLAALPADGHLVIPPN